MAIAIKLATVADSISKLSLTGVTIKDLDEIPTEILGRDVPMIIPVPNGFVTGMTPERVTLGSGASAKWDVKYQLNYRLLHSEIGTGRTSIFDTYAAMVTKAVAFVDLIMTNDAITGAVDIEVSNITDFGPVVDPTGKAFHGCDFIFDVLEHQD